MVKHRDTREVVVGGVLGPIEQPEVLVAGLYRGADLVVVGRSVPLTSAQSAELAAVLRPAKKGHPWPRRPGKLPHFTVMAVLPRVRSAKAAGAAARSRTAVTSGVSRPSRRRATSCANCSRLGSTTKKIARPSRGWTVGGSATVTRVPPGRNSA